MKATFIPVLLVAALPVIAIAQNAPVSTATNGTPQATDASLQNKLPMPGDSFVLPSSVGLLAAPTTPPTVDGALVRAARAGQIWQAVNPFAPAEFGQGYDNVSLDPHTRQPTGIVLVSFRFGGIGRDHR